MEVGLDTKQRGKPRHSWHPQIMVLKRAVPAGGEEVGKEREEVALAPSGPRRRGWRAGERHSGWDPASWPVGAAIRESVMQMAMRGCFHSRSRHDAVSNRFNRRNTL